MTELTILTVQLIVEFAKRIPGFEKLSQEDKITLLKVNSICLHSQFLILLIVHIRLAYKFFLLQTGLFSSDFNY